MRVRAMAAAEVYMRKEWEGPLQGLILVLKHRRVLRLEKQCSPRDPDETSPALTTPPWHQLVAQTRMAARCHPAKGQRIRELP